MIQPGTQAYYDTFSGLIPVLVMHPLDGDMAGWYEVKVVSDKAGYKKGEILEVLPTWLVSRKTRVRDGHVLVVPL